MIDLLNTIPFKPLELHIDFNGHVICQNCFNTIELTDNKCPNCNKDIDWSWFDDGK